MNSKEYSMYVDGHKVISELYKADSFISRFKGLMFRKSMPKDEGLWITSCRQVHCFNMRFAIDVLFLDKDGRVVHIEEAMVPRSVSGNVREACDVVELNAFRARELGIICGKQCEFRENK